MASLYVTEYAGLGTFGGVASAVAKEPEITTQVVSITGSSGASSAFNPATSFIRVHTDAICSVIVGTNPTATTSKKRLAANQTEYFAVPSGLSYKIAVISNT